MNVAAALPLDKARCAGRPNGLGPDDLVCDRRNDCLRYRAMLDHPRDQPFPRATPVHTGLCRDGSDWMIGGMA